MVEENKNMMLFYTGTGAMIIASIDHVDKVGEEAIGHCAKFCVKSFQVCRNLAAISLNVSCSG